MAITRPASHDRVIQTVHPGLQAQFVRSAQIGIKRGLISLAPKPNAAKKLPPMRLVKVADVEKMCWYKDPNRPKRCEQPKTFSPLEEYHRRKLRTRNVMRRLRAKKRAEKL